MKTQEQLIEKIESELEAFFEHANQYAESEDSPLAEFVESFFYGEADSSQLQFNNLSDDAAAILKSLVKSDRKKWMAALEPLVTLKHIPDMYRRDSEILSAAIGEQEHQLDLSPELFDMIQQLTPENFEIIKRRHFANSAKQTDQTYWVYTNHDFERWALIIDEDLLLETYSHLLEVQ